MGMFFWKLGLKIEYLLDRADCAIDTIKDYKDDLVDTVDTLKDCAEGLGEIAEGAKDLAEYGVELGRDYVGEKIDRHFENWKVVLSDDPYIDGKKIGYSRAAYHYEKLYEELQEQQKKLLLDIENQQKSLENDLNNKIILLHEMREYLKDAQNKKKEQEKKIANAHNLSIYEVSDFSLFPKNSTIFDLITSNKLQKKKRGELDGFEEASKLYQKKFTEENEIFQKRLKEYSDISEETINILKEIMEEINSVNRQIVTLDILE